ncbi:MAG: recombinase family protein [bacterium]
MENKELIRASIYVRVSTELQEREGCSLGEQERRCRAYCESKGWVLYKVYKDSDSGRNINRKKLQELIQDAGLGFFNVVVVFKLDRMSRNVKNMHHIIEEFDKREVNFVSITESLDTSSSVGRLTFNMLSSIAEFESDAIGERAYMGMLGKAGKCNYNGGTISDGYKVENKRLTIDETRTPIIRQIFELYCQGHPETKQEMSTSTIAKWLNEKNYHTNQHTTKAGKLIGGKKWGSETVRIILSNPVYYGVYTWNKYRIKRKDGKVISQQRDRKNWVYIENAHEPIVSKEIFLAAQEKLKVKRKASDKECQENYLFNGLLHFSPCGIKLEGWKKTRAIEEKDEIKTYEDKYYRCNPSGWRRIRGLKSDEPLTPHCEDCRLKYVRKEVIEPFLIEQVKNLQGRLPEIRELVEKLKVCKDTETEDLDNKEQNFIREKRILENEKQRLFDLLKKENIALDKFSQQIKEIAEREKKAEDELFLVSVQKAQLSYTEQDASVAEELILQFRDYLTWATDTEKKPLVQALVKRVDIESNGKVNITFRLPLQNREVSSSVVTMAT